MPPAALAPRLVRTFVQDFRSIGLTDEDMRQWHARFERTMPEAHRDFLESLGLDAQEVRRIRMLVPLRSGAFATHMTISLR